MHRFSEFKHLYQLLACISAGALLLATQGCKSGEGKDNAVTVNMDASSGSTADTVVVTQVEQQHVIGPAAARDLNYRVAWQNLDIGKNIQILTVQGDSVFALDQRNFLTRIRIQDGGRLWRIGVAEPIEQILGITILGDRVYVTTGAAMLVLEGGTGSQIGKQRFDRIASTAPVYFGGYLIYGARNGQVIWHSTAVGYQWRAYQVAHSIQLAPELSDGVLVVVGNDGTLISIDAAHATRYWSTELLDSVVASPTLGNGVVYVAGLDQHLRAYDLTSGQNLWKVLTESPLTDSPVLINDRIYQQIPGRGLSCFEALPPDSPGGKFIWKSEGSTGNVILQRRENLFVWDQKANVLNIIEAKTGSVVKSVNLPQVRKLVAAGDKGAELFAASDDGRLVRLVPRN